MSLEIVKPNLKQPRHKGQFGSVPPELRFWASVEIRPDGCWCWTGAPTKAGYGRLRVDGRDVYAHRFIYESLHNSIPEGFEIDHLSDSGVK